MDPCYNFCRRHWDKVVSTYFDSAARFKPLTPAYRVFLLIEEPLCQILLKLCYRKSSFLKQASHHGLQLTGFGQVWSKTFRAQFNQDPTKPLQLLNIAINITWLRNWLKSCLLYTNNLQLSSFPFQSIQSLLIRVITFPNWYKKNALACNKLVRK